MFGAAITAAVLGVPPPMPGLVARIGGTAFPHTTIAYLLDTSSDGKRLYTYTRSRLDGIPPSLFVWDTATGGFVARHPFGRGDDFVCAAALVPDGVRVFAVDSATRQLRVLTLDPATGRIVAERAGHNFPPSDAPDGGDTRYDPTGWIVRVERGVYHVLNATDGRRLRIDPVPHDHAETVFRPDGRVLAIVPRDKPARLYDLPGGAAALDLSAPDDEQRAGEFTPDGKMFALWTRRADGWSLDLWDIAAKTSRTLIEKESAPGRVMFTPDGKMFARFPQDWRRGTPRGEWEIRDLATGRATARAPADPNPNGAVFGADGKTLYTQPALRQVAAWDVATGRPKLPGVPGPVSGFRFDADGRLVGLAGGSVLTWNPRTGEELARTPFPRPPDHGYGAAFAPDGRRLSFVDLNRDLTHWDFRTKTERKFPVPETPVPGTPRERFTPDGRLQVAEDGGRLTIRVCETGEVIDRHVPDAWARKGRTLGVWARAASPDGRYLAVSSDDFVLVPGGAARALVTVFDLKHDAPPRTQDIEGGWQRSLAYSPDGRFLATAGYGAKVLDANTLRPLGSVYAKHRSARAVRIAPDNRTLALSIGHHEVRVVEVASWHVRAVLPSPWWNPEFNGSTNLRDPVAFSPDGRLIATATPEGGVLVWDARAIGSGPLPDLPTAWAALASDAPAALAGIRTFAASPAEAVPFLKEKLPPAVGLDAKRVAALIADLDDDNFAEREKASAELAKLGRAVAPALRLALEKGSPEARRRVGTLLNRLDADAPTPDELRAIRAVEAVEWMGTQDAVKLLEAWAAGADGARLTTEAKAALARTK